MKKILLIIALLISGLGLNAQSVIIDDLEFTVTSETPAECEVSGYSGEPTDVTIPSTVTISGKEYTVTSISGDLYGGTFSECSSLTSVTFGENSQLTSIGLNAFYGCSSLTSIDFGENSKLTSIGESAFKLCESLTSIEIPSGVTSIGVNAFYYCSSLTSIIVESGNTVYDSRDNCNAIIETATNTLIAGCQSTVIPNTVTSIGAWAFYVCSSLTSIDFGENSQLTSIGEDAFYSCSSLTSIEIPSGVTSIGDGAFSGCYSLTSIEFGENSQLTSIGKNAFSSCHSLTSIEIPSGVTSIGLNAFYGCSSLTSIDFGENSKLTSIGESAFYGCSSLTSIEIPSGVTYIGKAAFSGCSSLTSIVVESGNTVYDSRDNCNAIIETATNTLIAGCKNTVIPNSVTSIGGSAFYVCSSLTSIEIPSGVTSIGDKAFYDCSSLTSIELPSGVTSIGEDAFYSCSSLTSIEIPSGVTSIGDGAFSGCYSLTSIEFGENSQLTSIGNYAISRCSSLTSIEIPSSVTSIGYHAFQYCESLTSIYCYAESVPETYSGAFYNSFYNCPSDMVIYVPEQSVDAYKAASPWNEYTIMVMPYFVTVATNPEDAGIITGAGAYAINDTVTLTAIANEGYKFINWTENDSVVSEVAEYTFVVESDRNLVANFEEIEQPTDSVVLVAPALAVDTVTETTVVLVWNPIDSATSYNVYMDSVLVKNVTDTIYTVDSLISDSTYNFMVTAVADTLESEFSNAVTVTTLKAEGEEPEQPENPEEPGDEPEEPIELDAPENVEAKAISTSSIIITWDKVENALSYNIYRDGELLDDTENTSYTDKDLEYNTEYCYTIEAVNGKETSDESEEVCVKTLGEGVEEHETSFNIYPNPVSDKLYIETQTQTQTQTVEIYDVYGRRQSMVNGQQSTVIDVSDLNSGVYFVKVVTSEGEAVKRFVKK